VRVLVTGGFGYIGSHTVVELIQSGHDVYIIDNHSNSDPGVKQHVEKITGTDIPSDIIDIQHLDFPTHVHLKFDAVIHFAAHKSVGESMKEPMKYYQNNVHGTCNLLQAIKKAEIKNLVFSSSCTVYGDPDTCPVTEKFPIKPPSSVYGHTKQICEDIINNFHKEYEYNSYNLRYFNPVGSHESGLIGDAPTGVPDNLMPYITQTAARVRDKLTIFGDTYDTPDGTCIRDYIHVVDLAKAHVLAVENLTTFQPGVKDNINLGTGTGYSVKEMVDTFEKVNNVKIPHEIGPKRDGDLPKIYADPVYAYDVLGWRATHGLEDMVRSAWKYEQLYRAVEAGNKSNICSSSGS